MEQKSEILEELKQWQSPLADMPRNMPFVVPENYFSTLSANITASIHAENTPIRWNDRIPYTLPDNYFNTLPQDILAKARQAENIPTKKKTIALPLFVKAAAAVLIMALGIAGYQYFNTQPTITDSQLTDVPAEDISDYLQQTGDEVATDLLAYDETAIDVSSLEDIDSEEIVDYLDEEGWYSTKK